MSGEAEMHEDVVRWLDLVRPRRSLERRVWRSAHLDALRDVRTTVDAGPGTPHPDGASGDRASSGAPGTGRYPAVIGEIAAWEASTVRALGGHVRALVGPHNARVDGLRARIAALGPPPEVRAAALPVSRAEPGVTAVSASHPAAQARRRARLEGRQWAVADTERAALQAELAEAVALRTAAVQAARETARQCHESSLALQHLYWAVRTRWSRRRHGPPPGAVIADVGLPGWVVTPEVLYGGRRHDESAA